MRRQRAISWPRWLSRSQATVLRVLGQRTGGNFPTLCSARTRQQEPLPTNIFNSTGSSPAQSYRSVTWGRAVNAVHHGLGVTITPSMLSPLETEQQQIQYFSLPGDGGPFLRKTAVVYRKDTDLSRAEQDLIALICSEFGA